MSGKFRLALDALAALSVTGVLHNYGMHEIPERLSRAALPALIVAPVLDDTRRRQYNQFALATPTGASARVEYMVTHLLLHAPVGSGRGAATVMPALVDLIDRYAIAVRQNPRLSNTLFEPTAYSVYVAPVNYGGLLYYGCRFWHRFVIET